MIFKDKEEPIIPTWKMAEQMASVRRGVAELHGIHADFLDAGAIIAKMTQTIQAKRGIDLFA